MRNEPLTVSRPADVDTQKLSGNVYRSYNYVGTKETIAYLFNDFSNSFNINSFNDRFIWDVVKIDFGIAAIVNLFTGTWDVINDAIISAIVDNTRTRIGKFRPYMLMLQIPLTVLGLFYWCIPYLFPGSSGIFMPKLIFYFVFLVIQETATTFTTVAKNGYMTTITPNPNERVRLITLAELLTGMMGEDLPVLLLGFLYDLVNTGKLHATLRSIFLWMGVSTALISSACTLWFFIVSKERVPQTLEHPDLKAGFRAIFTNYPVLLLCLSEFLTEFGVSSDEQNYWIDVHGGTSMINTWRTIAGLPSAPVGSVSYAFVAPLRRRFSSRFLWVGSDVYGDMVTLAFFLFGMFRKNYLKLTPMLIAFGVRGFFEKALFGVNKVINIDLWNEAMDYCEWKNGYRMEATTGVAKSLVKKIQKLLMTSVRSFIMKKIGYVQGLKIGTQDERTKFWLFALCTIVPLVTSALGIVPKMLWPITRKKRAQMYYELSERRQKMVEDYLQSLRAQPPGTE